VFALLSASALKLVRDYPHLSSHLQRVHAISILGYERVEKCKDCVGTSNDMVIIGDRRFFFHFSISHFARRES
jgi:hypothetical protein